MKPYNLLLTYWILQSTGVCTGFLLADSLHLCQYIQDFDCSNIFTTGTLCGDDGVTYANHCEFSKGVCTDPSLKMAHTGPCQPEKIQQELVLNFTCADILTMNCSRFNYFPTYCGTDGNTYHNVCHFEKARCQNHNLYLNHFGACTTAL